MNVEPKVAWFVRLSKDTASGNFRFEHSNDRLFFNNLVVVDMLFLSGNDNVIASNKQVSVVLEWN